MATKKHTKRRRRTMSAPKRTHKRRRKSRGLMGDLFNPTIAMHSVKQTLAATGGGMGAVFVNKMIPATTGKLMKVGISLGVGFLAASFGFPSAGAGFTGGMTALSFQNGLMGDDDLKDNEFADGNSLEEMPLYLDASGEPFVIEEDEKTGESYTRYLSDDEKQMLNDEN